MQGRDLSELSFVEICMSALHRQRQNRFMETRPSSIFCARTCKVRIAVILPERIKQEDEPPYRGGQNSNGRSVP